MTSDIKVGDWVRFYRGGVLVIGVVEYIRERKAWERADELQTTAGAVNADYVLESRSK